MSGLHNKYPEYFYKPGNLFGTYLGTEKPHVRPDPARSDRAEAPPVARTEPRTPTSPPAPIDAAKALESRSDEPQGRLWAFVKANLSPAQAAAWATAVGTYKEVRAPENHEMNPWIFCRALIGHELTGPECEAFLAALQAHQ
jgi:hypothetical protein